VSDEEIPTITCLFVDGPRAGLQEVMVLGGLPDRIKYPHESPGFYYVYALEPISEHYHFIGVER
jgi:hypothetical protein